MACARTLKRWSRLAGLAWMVLFAGAAQAAEWHVALGGRNADSGGRERPWATLQHAVDQARPGDVIMVHEGSYEGCRISSSGREDAWLTLRAAPGEKVLINRPGPQNKHRSNLELETWNGDRTVSYWIVQGFEVTDAPWAGIDVRGQSDAFNHHIVVKDNEVRHSGRTGIFAAFCDDLLIEGNQSHHNGEHGVYVSNSSDRPVIKENLCHDNYACGLHLNGDASMGGDGLIAGARLTGNVLYGNGRGGGAAINLDGVVESEILSNTIFNNRAGGVAIFYDNGAEASRDLRLENNLIRMPLGSRWAVNIADRACRDIVMLNNTFFHADPRRGAVRAPAADLPGLQSDYNRVSDRFSVDGGGSLISLTAWRAYGLDLNSSLVSEADLE